MLGFGKREDIVQNIVEFGHSTVVPTITGRTCGVNIAPFCVTDGLRVVMTCAGISGELAAAQQRLLCRQ